MHYAIELSSSSHDKLFNQVHQTHKEMNAGEIQGMIYHSISR